MTEKTAIRTNIFSFLSVLYGSGLHCVGMENIYFVHYYIAHQLLKRIFF